MIACQEDGETFFFSIIYCGSQWSSELLNALQFHAT